MNPPSLKKMKELYKAGDLTEVARWLPHLRHEDDTFIKFLMDSNILKMRKHINDPPITLGADPEFILHEKGKPYNIVLFSSEYTTDYFGLSEAELGADYGLLEFRPGYSKTPDGLVDNMNELYRMFKEHYPQLRIFEKEAVKFNHKRARILESLQSGEEINYGMNRGKDTSVWNSGSENNIVGIESGVSLSAYNKPIFNQFDDALFTAGGHIHVGGSYIMMLSTIQLGAFVRKLDQDVLPMCEKVETKAAKLRRGVYGNPGEFRIKDYGIEYRSPSNAIFWKKNLSTLLEVLHKVVNIVGGMAI